MPKNKQKPQSQANPMTPNWMYDYVMGQIEPDLTTARMPFLDDHYKGESPTEYRERMMHYEEAFKMFDSVIEDVVHLAKDDARQQKNQARAQLHMDEHAQRDIALRALEKLLDDDSASASTLS